jgi:hypothetical protein
MTVPELVLHQWLLVLKLERMPLMQRLTVCLE